MEFFTEKHSLSAETPGARSDYSRIAKKALLLSSAGYSIVLYVDVCGTV